MSKIVKSKINISLNDELLSLYGLKNDQAIYLKKEQSDIRPPFYRDIDRIIHSMAFTRYLDKTQVYSLNKNMVITKRIVHVMLVSKIARTIGRMLGLNEDLIEAIALGHDIGHVPFGHEGERILNKITLKYDLGFFNHNIHSVRNYLEVDPKNLTLQTLDGMMCHNGEMPREEYRPKAKTKKVFLAEYAESYNNKEANLKLRPMTLEGCVVRISDIIGYLGRDVEDAIVLGKIARKDLPIDVVKVLGNSNSEIINTIVLDIVSNSLDKPYIKMSKEIYQAIMSLRNFNYKNIYLKANTKEQLNEYEHMFEVVFQNLVNDYKKDDKNSLFYTDFIDARSVKYIQNNNVYQMAVDFIASMTDTYFTDMYKMYLDKVSNR